MKNLPKIRVMVESPSSIRSSDSNKVKELKCRIHELESQVRALKCEVKSISENRDYYYNQVNARWPGEDLF